MELKFVGAMPQVSARGVGFDQTRADKYPLINATVELLEAQNKNAGAPVLDMRKADKKEYSGSELVAHLENYGSDLDDVVAERDEVARKFVGDIVERVKADTKINEEERTVWLKNIDLMTGYFLQHIMNETAYKYVLNSLGEKIHEDRLEQIIFPVYRHFGEVLHDLTYVLEHRKPLIDSIMEFAKENETPIGIFVIKQPLLPKPAL